MKSTHFIALSVSLAFSTSAVATVLTDPFDNVSPDIRSLSATYDQEYLYFEAQFSPNTFSATSANFIVGIDIDRNLQTGTSSAGGVFFPLGADFTVSSYSLSTTHQDQFNLNRQRNGDTPGGRLGYLTPKFVQNGFVVAVPRAVVGYSGSFNFGLAAGTPRTSTSFTPTDFVVMSPFGSDFGTPTWAYNPNYVSAVSEPTTLALYLVGSLGVFFIKRRRPALKA